MLPAVKLLHIVWLGLWQSLVWSVFWWDLNVEQVKEVFHAAHENLFAMTEQLQMPHNCMSGCESILAVRGTWLISVCGFCLCDVRSWKSHVWWWLGMKELFNLLQRCRKGEAGPFPWPGRSCEFTLLDSVYWYVTEHIYRRVIQKVSALLYFPTKWWGREE